MKTKAKMKLKDWEEQMRAKHKAHLKKKIKESSAIIVGTIIFAYIMLSILIK